MVLHLNMQSAEGAILSVLNLLVALLNFAATTHQDGVPTCSQWFLKISTCLVTMTISKRCHKVHDSYIV